MSRGKENRKPKTFSKKVEKTLDKNTKKCYNKGTKRGQEPLKKKKGSDRHYGAKAQKGQKMDTTKMTTRDHLNAIIEGKLTAETQAWAQAQIEALDRRKAKRTEKPSKTAEANAPIKAAILNYLTENKGNKYTEAELGAVIEATHNKAGSLVRQLVAEGKVSVEEVKIPKVGKRKAYFIAE